MNTDRHNRTLFRLFALIMVLGLVLSACVPAAPAPAGQEPAAAEPTEAAAEEAPATAEPAEAAPATGEGSLLRFGHSQRPNDFNPLAVIQGIQTYIQKWTFSKLITLDRNAELIPDLAESYTVSDDGTVFTFTLRQDVTWHDGEPFTAEDVVFTFNYLLNPAAGARKLSNFQVIQGAAEYGEGAADAVEGVQATGDYEVQFTLTAPNAVFLVDLADQSIIPEHVVSQIDPADFLTSEFVTQRPYPGTGAYVFERYETDQFIDLSANPDYFRGAPQIARIRIESIPDNNTRIIALENGEVDLIMDVPAEELERLQGVEGIEIITHDTPTVSGTFVDSDQSKEEPLKVAMRQPQFRQALVHAMDFDALIVDVLEGTVSRQQCMFIQDWACDPALTEYPYDPERARELLAEIGWDPTWEVDWMVLAAQLEPIHAVLQQMYADVGINMVPRPVDGPTFVENFYANGTFDVTFVGYGAGTDPNVPANNFLVCGQIYPNGFNGTRYCNDRVTELVAAGREVISQEERAPIYQEISRINNEELPLIPLWRGQVIAAARDNVNLQYNHYYWDDVNEWTIDQ
jgi:peptide/nickel transport system substrate-binding protein